MILFQKGDSGHDLTGLAVPALRCLFGDPGLLNGVASVGRKAFYSGDFLPGYQGNRDGARALRSAIDMHGAGATLGDTATIFRPSHVQGVAQNPE
jgi:hypothetical protein